MEGHQDWLQNSALVNCGAVNIDVAVSVSCADFKSFGYMLKSGITGSNGGSLPSFLRNLHTAFQSGCTSL